jgi:hypothetical protein
MHECGCGCVCVCVIVCSIKLKHKNLMILSEVQNNKGNYIANKTIHRQQKKHP